RSECGQRISGRWTRPGGLFDLGKGACQRTTLSVLDCAGRQVGEDHQWPFGAYLGPFTPHPAFARIGPRRAPTTMMPTEIHTNSGASKQNATVPAATPISMTTTAVQAAGECPWP